MFLKIRLIDFERGQSIESYAECIRRTLDILQSLAPSQAQWVIPGRPPKPIPTDPATFVQTLGHAYFRNNIGQIVEDMGYSLGAFLDLGEDGYIYGEFSVGSNSPHTTDMVFCEMPHEFAVRDWEAFIKRFVELITVWMPQRADIYNWEALTVVSEDLIGRSPHGFACYSSDAPQIKAPPFAECRSVGKGTLCFLKSPKFDASSEEGEKLLAITNLFEKTS